jgi:putative membrane protein
VSEVVDLRILQANERTLLAWVRTGLALMAFGFVVARLALWLRHEAPADREAFSLGVGATMLGLGAACQVIGAVRFLAARRALVAGRSIQPGAAGPVAVALLLAAVAILLVLYLLLAA